MKKTIIIILTTIAFISTASAQKAKIGHVNSNKIFEIMPEKTTATEEVQKHATMLEEQLQSMQAELQKKYEEYMQNKETYTPIISQNKEKEIQDLDARIKTFSQTAQQDLAQKEQDLLKPIYDKIQKAIDKVAKENGYTYIFDSAAMLYISEDSNDIFELVKKEIQSTTTE